VRADLPGAEILANHLADLKGPRSDYDEREGLRPAAVMLPLVDTEEGASLLFTRRSRQLPHHRGQVAFPGGLREECDDGPYATALRESVEEVGVEAGAVRFIASLDPTETLREFRILPFLSLWPSREYSPKSEDEVERVFTVALAWLLDPGSQRQVILEEGGHRLSVPAFSIDGEIIWGATFRMTQDLLARLRKAFP
jgi:8-oxo-dGTP pyrophosphatase MutT (NUDIX family)